ncbi:MAG: hypothetical protein KAS66_01320 [Candidatus Omnitrophica bacterium]|nr:hypothetical protein [Candidatus Omnitrophota bacterium]
MSRSPISIFSGTTGINNKVDPSRLRFDPKTGIVDLAAAVNTDVDDTGRPSRRRGRTATVRTEAWKNLFGCGSYGVGTKGDALCVIESGLSYTAIRNINASAKMSYVRDTDGEQDVVYYTNGHENGKIINKVSYAWSVGEKTSETKEFSAAPIGHLIEKRKRMFIAQDNILWYSEPNSNDLYRLGTNHFRFMSRTRMVQAVAGGLWVSDSDAIYFLGGEINPSNMEMPLQEKMADYPVSRGTGVKVPGSKIGDEGLSGIVVMFTTNKGVCIGTRDGQLINATERKIDLPSSLTGAGLYKDGKYICVID